MIRCVALRFHLVLNLGLCERKKGGGQLRVFWLTWGGLVWGLGVGEVLSDDVGYATQADRSDGVETDPAGESGIYGCGVPEVHYGDGDEDGE